MRQFSLKSILVLLGLSSVKVPDENQKISMLADCVNDMFDIGADSPKSVTNSAFNLSVTSKDPVFSANLANQIVKRYFIWHEQSRDKNFESVKKYLSKIISESQLELIEANKLMQNFIIRHTLLMNISSGANEATKQFNAIGTLVSPFKPELTKEIANLSQLERSRGLLTRAKLKLLSFREESLGMTAQLTLQTDIQGVLSRAFVKSLSIFDGSSIGSSLDDESARRALNKELKRLEQQIEVVENKIKQKEGQTQKLMNIENKFQNLAIDVQKKRLIFEGLKDQLKEKIISTGLQNVGQPILLTRATPPFNSVSPNKKLILILGAFGSMFLGLVFILIRQVFLKRIYSISQIKNLSDSLSCYEIKLKQLELMRDNPGEAHISQSFFSDTKGKGKLGCVIDLSQKTSRDNSYATTFTKAFAKLLVADNTKVICLESLPTRKPFLSNALKSFKPNSSYRDAQDIADKGSLTLTNEDILIRAGEVKSIKEKYSEYDKIICSVDSEVDDLTKFKFIEECDFYILIGKSFYADEYNCKKFSNSVWEKEKKCLGFFLIN